MPLAGGVARRFDDAVGGRVAVGQLAVFMGVDIRERPGVLEGRARRNRADWRGVILVGIEGRVEVDQVDAGRVDAAHDV